MEAGSGNHYGMSEELEFGSVGTSVDDWAAHC